MGVLLAGCSTKTWQTMWFTQASSIFSDTIQNIQQTTNNLWFTWSKSVWLFLDIFGENKDFKLNSNILLSGAIDYTNQQLKSNTALDLYFWDKHEKQENIVSWDISNVFVNNELFFILNDSYIDIWTGNYQSKLLSLIVKNLENKRIVNNIPQHQNMTNLLLDLNYILATLSSWHIFQMTEQASYEGKLAYKVSLTPEIIQDINTNTDFQIDSFQWLLIVRSASKVELKIEQLQITHKNKSNSISINGHIAEKDWILKFQTMPDDIIQIWRKQARKSISLAISKTVNQQKLVDINLKLYPKLTPTETKTQINWILSISPLIIYGSDLEKNIEIDINWEYYAKDIENTQIKKPDSYILWEQILWDKFSLETIMSD